MGRLAQMLNFIAGLLGNKHKEIIKVHKCVCEHYFVNYPQHHVLAISKAALVGNSNLMVII